MLEVSATDAPLDAAATGSLDERAALDDEGGVGQVSSAGAELGPASDLITDGNRVG